MSFSATEAAFEGFRLVRRQPLAIVFWSLAYLLFFALAFALLGSSLATIMATTEGLKTTGEPSVAEIEALGQSFTGLFVLAMPLGLVLGAVLNTAVARAVLRPAERRFGYLRLGADELRVLLVTVVLALIMGVVAIVGFTIVGVLAGLTQASGQPILWLAVFAAGQAVCALVIWLSVKLSLAVPVTVAERRIALFDSFALTTGRFWPLLGMAILAVIMTILVSLLSGVIAAPLTLLTGATGMQSLAGYDGRSTVEIFQAAGPAIVIWCLLNAIFSALQLAVMYAPFSAAYRDIKGLPAE